MSHTWLTAYNCMGQFYIAYIISPLRPSAVPGAPALALGVWSGVKGGGRGPPLLGAAGKILKSIVLSWIILYETRNYLLKHRCMRGRNSYEKPKPTARQYNIGILFY